MHGTNVKKKKKGFNIVIINFNIVVRQSFVNLLVNKKL